MLSALAVKIYGAKAARQLVSEVKIDLEDGPKEWQLSIRNGALTYRCKPVTDFTGRVSPDRLRMSKLSFVEMIKSGSVDSCALTRLEKGTLKGLLDAIKI